MSRTIHVLADSGGSDRILINSAGYTFAGGKCSILRASMSVSPYQIEANFNTFNLREVAVDFLVTITPGNYTLTAFATELTTQLNAAGANTYLATGSASTGLLTITRTAGAAAWSLRLASFPRMAAIMGFAATDFAVGAGPVSGTLPVRLQAAGYYLVSDALSSGPAINMPNRRRIGWIANNSGPFQVSTQFSDENIFYTIDSGTLDFSLENEFGTAASLNGGLLIVEALIQV